jgi:hypothetical protein
MDNVRVRCKSCNKELEGNSGRVVSCGCNNMTTIRYNEKITCLDFSDVIMLNTPGKITKKKGILSSQDIAWQEERRKRKVRKLDFEIR